jgi:ferredoxin
MPGEVMPGQSPAPGESQAPDGHIDGQVTILLEKKRVSVPRVEGETLLESARRAGLTPPFSCEAGNCGTCMARLTEGRATMRVNDALMDDEIEDGYVLTCQAVPDTPSVTVNYDD